MEFYPVSDIVLIDKTIGMAAETVHVTISFGNSAVTHHYGYLVQSFWQQSPEIPVIIGTSQIGFGISLHSMVQIGKFHGIAEKENRCIISYQIPDAFICIKF